MHLQLVTNLEVEAEVAAGVDAKASIREPSERPRERMLLFGPAALADVELVALLLGGGRSLQRAQAVLEAVGGLGGLSRACAHELREISGIGDATATAPGPRWPWLAAWLLVSAGLWGLERSRAGRA